MRFKRGRGDQASVHLLIGFAPCGLISFKSESVGDAVLFKLLTAVGLVVVVDDVSARLTFGAVHVEQVSALQGVASVVQLAALVGRHYHDF